MKRSAGQAVILKTSSGALRGSAMAASASSPYRSVRLKERFGADYHPGH